ncbi:NGP1NT domain-containing protein [Heracleum sosnowskyi]|uniref:NGP1NT domain-containing protein n=1 Tax=Heracleum sosnowskyi TaxID=360622 RepID=A0AAD8JM75_9APIA|nr:NGP1NT domain-containing protein [Heracleum sosnowskyi]
MGKKRGRSVNVSSKPKHSLDANRTKGSRTAATVRRLKMYNKRPKRDRKGNILKHDLQSKELPSTRIQPDPRWFDGTQMIHVEKRPAKANLVSGLDRSEECNCNYMVRQHDLIVQHSYTEIQRTSA